MGRIIEIPFSKNLIQFIAEELMEQGCLDFSSNVVIFSHHRPGLYLHKSMAESMRHSFFPPQIFSMDDFMLYLSKEAQRKTAGGRRHVGADLCVCPDKQESGRHVGADLCVCPDRQESGGKESGEAQDLPEAAMVKPMDSIYLLFQVVCSLPDNPWKRLSLNQFIPWGLKLEQVISEMDIEMISSEKLHGIEIGEDFQTEAWDNIGNHLSQIRQGYHSILTSHNLTTRALTYCFAANNIHDTDLSQFKHIYLVGLFAMTQSETMVVQHILKQAETTIIRQSDGNKWTPFEEMDEWAEREDPECRGKFQTCPSAIHKEEIKERHKEEREEMGDDSPSAGEAILPEIFLYRAFNTHSEVAALRDVLMAQETEFRIQNTEKTVDRRQVEADLCVCPDKQNSEFRSQNSECGIQIDNGHLLCASDHEKTAIVLPSSEALIPLLSEVITALPVDYNISMGYPVMRTPVYALLDMFMVLYRNRVDNAYYLEDYLNLLMHPYIKNIRSSTQTRILVHAVEGVLIAQEKRFITLEEIEQNSKIFESAFKNSPGVSPAEFMEMLTDIHNRFIRKMDGIHTLRQMAGFFEDVLTFLLKNSPASHYPFSSEFFHKFFDFIDTLKDSMISSQCFENISDLLEVFLFFAQDEQVYFEGSPVKGLQILGLLETRCLNFDKVFIIDVNEGVLPGVEIFCPLLPLPVRRALKMSTYYQREEISRYHFRRLIASSQEVHIIYQETEKKRRSRFVERLVWEKEKSCRELNVLEAKPVTLNISLALSHNLTIDKTPEIIAVLNTMKFSPTSLNTYLQCPAKFYFSKVLRLEEKEDIYKDTDATEPGIILHQVLELLYKPLINEDRIRYDYLESNLRGVLDKIFRQRVGEIRGEKYLLQEMMFKRIKSYLDWEKEHFNNTRRVVSIEDAYTFEVGIRGDAETRRRDIRLTGKIDRIDCHDEEYEIIDYKSGNIDKSAFKCFDRILVSRKEMKREITSLQLPCYILLYHGANPDIPIDKINSSVISIQTHAEKMLFNDKNKNIDRDIFLRNIFLPTLKNLIHEILDPCIPFASDSDEGKGSTSNGCEYCAFPVLCRR
ncbi:MAG: PD-(D/E)XK nuclease family protein [bacterium]